MPDRNHNYQEQYHRDRFREQRFYMLLIALIVTWWFFADFGSGGIAIATVLTLIEVYTFVRGLRRAKEAQS
jgi:multisubunit Na+/H+ antiporter MnhE subunit